MPGATGEDMVTKKQQPASPFSNHGCAIPCLLIFGVFLFTGFLISAPPFIGVLLALVVIAGAIALIVKRDWQDNFFGPIGVDTSIKRYFVLGFTIWSMLMTFTSTDEENANTLWAEGKKSEAVELYVAELENSNSPNPKEFERVIEYYFENGDTNQAKYYCNKAIEADVELSLNSKALRDFFTKVRKDHALKLENQKIAEEAKQKAEVAKKEAEKEKHERDLEIEAQKHLDVFLAVLKTAEVTLVKRVSVHWILDGVWVAEIEVRNNWHIKPYQIRLQDAQNLWSAWARIASPQDRDLACIKIVDANRNEVGGSHVPVGSLIWVQEN